MREVSNLGQIADSYLTPKETDPSSILDGTYYSCQNILFIVLNFNKNFKLLDESFSNQIKVNAPLKCRKKAILCQHLIFPT